MKVVLNKDVKNVGKMGQIKEVADGFARNFLIPNKLAEAASKSSVQKIESVLKKNEEDQKESLKNVQDLAEKLKGREIIIKAKAKKGKLFGSVDEKMIVEELAKEGIEIEKSCINLATPIKETGETKIQISLGHGIETGLKIIVEEDN